MDDGGWLKSSKAVRISFNNLTLAAEPVILFKNMLHEKFKLNCTGFPFGFCPLPSYLLFKRSSQGKDRNNWSYLRANQMNSYASRAG